MSKKTVPAHEIGSGNIFADLGLPNAEEHQLKAALVVQLSRIIGERKLDTWLRMQMNYDLAQIREKAASIKVRRIKAA